MRIQPSKKLSFMIVGCAAALLISNSVFSGLMSSTSISFRPIQQAFAAKKNIKSITEGGCQTGTGEGQNVPCIPCNPLTTTECDSVSNGPLGPLNTLPAKISGSNPVINETGPILNGSNPCDPLTTTECQTVGSNQLGKGNILSPQNGLGKKESLLLKTKMAQKLPAFLQSHVNLAKTFCSAVKDTGLVNCNKLLQQPINNAVIGADDVLLGIIIALAWDVVNGRDVEVLDSVVDCIDYEADNPLHNCAQ
jgi:hypothetical protein